MKKKIIIIGALIGVAVIIFVVCNSPSSIEQKGVKNSVVETEDGEYEVTFQFQKVTFK